MADRPYSRHYWEWADEYPELYENDAACALWYRLVRLADMAWPSSATLPVGTRKAAIGALIGADLIRMVTRTTYKVRGMDKEREARSQSASNAARSRWSDASRNATRNADGNAKRNAETMPSRAKPSQAEPSPVPDALETYFALTTRPPSKTVIDWLGRLESVYGIRPLVASMAATWTEDPDPSTFLGRVQANLAIKANQAAKASDERKRTSELQRLEEERSAIEAMPEEVREANRERLRQELQKSGLLA
jgi:hypothetical protein